LFVFGFRPAELSRFDAVAARPLSARVQTGVAFGLLTGVAFAGLGLVIAVLAGTATLQLESGERYSGLRLLPALILGLATSGGVFGALFPLMRYPVGTFFGSLTAAIFPILALTLAQPVALSTIGRLDAVFIVCAAALYAFVGFFVRGMVTAGRSNLR
jgi:hypothetical protein